MKSYNITWNWYCVTCEQIVLLDRPFSIPPARRLPMPRTKVFHAPLVHFQRPLAAPPPPHPTVPGPTCIGDGRTDPIRSSWSDKTNWRDFRAGSWSEEENVGQRCTRGTGGGRMPTHEKLIPFDGTRACVNFPGHSCGTEFSWVTGVRRDRSEDRIRSFYCDVLDDSFCGNRTREDLGAIRFFLRFRLTLSLRKTLTGHDFVREPKPFNDLLLFIHLALRRQSRRQRNVHRIRIENTLFCHICLGSRKP
jgi:hypothetical protein